MKRLISLLAVSVVLLLTACGGGGGCAGTLSDGTNTCNASSTATTTTTTTPTAPTPPPAAAQINVAITDSAGVTLPSPPSISSGTIYYAQATVVDGTGAPLNGQIVSFSTDNTVGSLASAMGLTGQAGPGIARVQISPASLTTVGVAVLTATSAMPAGTVTGSIGYQTGASNVALGPITVTPATVTAVQTASVSAPVTVNGVAATPGQVSVNLSPSCGYFTSTTVPAITVPTGTGGVASATWQSVNSCGGATVTFTSTASGATTPGTGSIDVTAVQPANIQYTGATATTLVVASASGTKQSTVSFKVVDGANQIMASVPVTISLDQQSISLGVSFNVNGASSTAPQSVPTNSLGMASATIQSSPFPTPVIVTAALTAVPTMTATSSGIVVTAGKASQNRTSLAATILNIEGRDVDGVTTLLTLRTADRQGNAVPAGTAVTFISTHGTIGGSCVTDATGACSVTYTTSGATRGFPFDGVVTILAYLDGEESFTDLNGDNVWQNTELFFDMGQAYVDFNHDGVFQATEQMVGNPAGVGGTLPCFGTPYPSVDNTCDNTWSPSIRVRTPILLGLSSNTAAITAVGPVTTSGFTIQIADAAPGSVVSMASGSTITAAVTTSPTTCAVTSPAVFPSIVRNAVFPSTYDIGLNNNACSGQQVTVTVTTPAGHGTLTRFTIP